MSNIVKVDIKDKFRILLTDVLPYELPLWFTNYNIYNTLRNSNNFNCYVTISGLQGKSNILIPLDYQISRGGSHSPRTISIMHPIAQLKVCDFYDKYDCLIEYFCTKSKHSLRHPYRIATKFYGKVQKGSKSSDGVEGIDEERITSSSYFKYKKYPFLYRFFESYEYHRLEKQFHSMMQVDISKCFPSIYTHSIGWAVKNKKMAKTKPAGSFDGEFDALMQATNYNETNGIIVGPEVSRIFAEIILQKIDLNLIEKMLQIGYRVSKDYDFRRYVDDYFVFYRSDDIRTAFIKVLELCLLEYKMYLNEAKTTLVSRPFATKISLAKQSLKYTVDDCFTSRYKNHEATVENITKLSHPDTKANKIISKIKMSLAQYNVEYISVSNYLLSAVAKRTLSYLHLVRELSVKEEYHLNWLLVDLDVIFFIHAMDIRIRPTDRLGKMIYEVLKLIELWPNNYRNIVSKKIFDHIKQAITIFIDNSTIMGLETLNLLIILTMLPEKYQLQEKKLQDYLVKLKGSSSTKDCYFYWVSFMLYIRDKAEYSNIRSELVNDAEAYLLHHNNMFIDTEYFVFYFDYMACPYIDKARRKNIIEKVKTMTYDHKGKLVLFDCNKQSSHILFNDFVVSWRDPSYLVNSLEKKEYLFPYN